MDNSFQQFGNQWQCAVPKICETQDILLTNLTFPEEAQAREFKKLRDVVSSESLIGNEAESSARRLIELVTVLPEAHIAQAVVRLEAARTFYAGSRYSEASKYCEEALVILDRRSQDVAIVGRYDKRMRFDLLELAAAAHEFDGEDHAALNKWALLPEAATAAIQESKEDPLFDEPAHREFIEEIITNLTEGWFSSTLSVPKSLEALQRNTAQTLLSGVADSFNTLLVTPIDPSEFSTLKVESELIPSFSHVLYLYARHFSREGDYLSAEKLLSHRLETLKEYTAITPSLEHSLLMRNAWLDLIRTRVDRGAVSLATESVRELFTNIDLFSQKELRSVMEVVRSVLQHSDEDNLALLSPLICDQFKQTKFPRLWLGLVSDLVGIAIDLRKSKYARRLLAEVSKRIDVDSDTSITAPVRASLLYGQINCLVKIDRQYRLRSELPQLAEELAENLITHIESSPRSFSDRCFFLFMGGILMITSLQDRGLCDRALTYAKRVVQAINVDELSADPRTLGALHHFIELYFELELPDRSDAFDRIRSSFSLLSRAVCKDFCESRTLDINLIASLGTQFSNIGLEYLSIVPSFTTASQKVATRLQKVLPRLLSKIDSEVMTDEVLKNKVNLVSALAEAVKFIEGEESSEFKSVSARLESARRALRHRLE